MKKYFINDIEIAVHDNGYFVLGVKDSGYVDTIGPCGTPNFEVATPSKKSIPLGESGFVFGGVSEADGALLLTYLDAADSIEVTVKLEYIKGINVIAQSCTAKNIGEGTAVLSKFSSVIFDNIATDAELPYYKNEDIKIYLCHNKWQGEAQWKTYSPAELGIYPGSVHPWERASFKMHAVGSWPCANFYPLTLVEDSAHGNISFVELEGGHGWQIKLTGFGGYTYPKMLIEASGCDESNGGWFIELKSGESYTNERAFYGVVSGGFEEAAAELVAFKRADSLIKHKDNCPPVFFNDYMACIWGSQTPDRSLKLIDVAAKVGCEYFVIDGGWESNKSGDGFGDWVEKPANFSEITIRDLAEKIKQKGMIPGIWFEFEACTPNAYGASLDDDALLKRYGAPVGNHGRYFYNMTNEKVREYLKSRVREYYDMGYRFIKNDYNQNTGIGATNTYDGSSCAEGLIRNTEAFYSFIGELYAEFPDLVIENCGSGAMRDENKTLRRFALQSTSDQEIYYNNPSIIIGSSILMPPEKAGIWSYPYPTTFLDHATFVPTEEFMAERADGKETAFNTVSTLMGVFYQSGRIDVADEKNLSLVKEGVEIYKRIRKYHAISRPVYPTGLCNINERKVASLGLLSSDRLLLAVWNISDTDSDVSLDLAKYVGENATIVTSYAAEDYGTKLSGGILTSTMTPMSATFLEIAF